MSTDPCSELFDFSRRIADANMPELRAQAPTVAMVIGGLAVWGLFLLLML